MKPKGRPSSLGRREGLLMEGTLGLGNRSRRHGLAGGKSLDRAGRFTGFVV